MSQLSEFFATGLGTLVLIVLIIQAVLWFCVPFMIWSISKRIRILTNYYLGKDGMKLGWWNDIVPLRRKSA